MARQTLEQQINSARARAVTSPAAVSPIRKPFTVPPIVEEAATLPELAGADKERLYTVTEVAKFLRVGDQWVRNHFKDWPGVLIFKQPGSRRRPRKHGTMRIPHSALATFIRSHDATLGRRD